MRPESQSYEKQLQEQARIRLEEIRKDSIYQAFRTIVSTPEGRLVFATLLQQFPFDADPYTANAMEVSYRLGYQAVSRWIRLELFEKGDCEDLYFQMKKEVRDRLEAQEGEVKKVIDGLRKRGG